MPSDKVPCKRCGVMRWPRGGPLCRDCMTALTPKERKQWLSPKAV